MDNFTVIGPPGTGKTHYIEGIIQREKPRDYLYLTYNHGMAAYARKRIEDDKHKIGTIHSIMSQRNGLHEFLGLKEWIEFAKMYGLTYPIRIVGNDSKNTDETDLERFLRYYDMTVNIMAKPRQPINERLNMPYLFDAYEKWKHSIGKMDYTDILKIAAEGHYYAGMLFIDEAQDLSPLMWKIIESIDCDVRYIVGDPHQSINSFRGVRVNDFISRMGSNVEVLKKSYRYGDNIRELADRILGDAKVIDNDYVGMGNSTIDQYSLSQFVHLPGTKAILCRTNALAYHIARKTLSSYAVTPISKEHSYGNGWTTQVFKIADIMKRFPHIDAADFGYILEHSPADLWVRGTKTKAKKETTLFSYDLMRKRIDAAEIVRRLDIKSEAKGNIIKYMTSDVPVIQADTIHSAKGMEWDHVMLMLDFPSKMDITNEEHRLFYVGATRARKSLDFSYIGYYKELFPIPGHRKLLYNARFF